MASVSNPIELMSSLGNEYRRIRTDHERESSNGTTRRRIEQHMGKIAERFEKLLAHWVHDPSQSDAWREFFYHDGEQPDEPVLRSPPAFRGETSAGTVVEIRETELGYEVFLDGARVDRVEIPWQPNPDRYEPVLVGELACEETFAAPHEAIAALQSFLETSGARPPWTWARALYDDGLIDADFGLTPRGARRMQSERAAPAEEAAPGSGAALTNYCVVVANASRARIFTLQTEARGSKPALEPLVEVADCSNRLARARDAEQLSDTRPGLRREGPDGPRHGVSDRRENRRKEEERHYAQQVADVAAQVFRQFDRGRLVVTASPHMLSLLRPAMARHLNGQSHLVTYEHPVDLTWQSAAAIHDALATAELLPSRGRQPPPRPMRTPNPWQGG